MNITFLPSLLDFPRSSPRKARGKAFRASRRLAVERLEDRRMMASSITAALAGGVLRIQGSAAAELFDIRQSSARIGIQGVRIQTGTTKTALVSVSAVKRIDVQTGGGNDTVRMDLGRELLSVPVSLNAAQGTNRIYSGGTSTRLLSLGGALQSERGPDGTVFWLDGDRALRVSPRAWVSESQSDAWSNGGIFARNVEDFALGRDGSVYMLITGVVWHFTLDRRWETIDSSGVTKFEINPVDGSVWSLAGNGWLNVNGRHGWANTRDFALGRDGALYKLSKSNALHCRDMQAQWTLIGVAVTKFQINPADGYVWSLGADGWLCVKGRRGWANTRDFALGSDGTLYKLGKNDGLWRRNPNLQWIPLDTGVAKFQLQAATDTVWTLGRDGWLKIGTAQAWSNTKDFSLGPDGAAYRLTSTKQLFRLQPGDSDWLLVGRNLDAIPALVDDLSRTSWMTTDNGRDMVYATERSPYRTPIPDDLALPAGEDRAYLAKVLRRIFPEGYAALSAQEKCIRIMRFVASYMRAQSNTGSTAAKILKDGYSACGGMSFVFRILSRYVGVPARTVSIFNIPGQGNHSLTEVYYDRRWHLYDPTFGVLFFSAPKFSSAGYVLSLQDLLSSLTAGTMMTTVAKPWQGFSDATARQWSVTPAPADYMRHQYSIPLPQQYATFRQVTFPTAVGDNALVSYPIYADLNAASHLLIGSRDGAYIDVAQQAAASPGLGGHFLGKQSPRAVHVPVIAAPKGSIVEIEYCTLAAANLTLTPLASLRVLGITRPASNIIRFRVEQLADTSIAVISGPNQTLSIDSIRIRRISLGSETGPPVAVLSEDGAMLSWPLIADLRSQSELKLGEADGKLADLANAASDAVGSGGYYLGDTTTKNVHTLLIRAAKFSIVDIEYSGLTGETLALLSLGSLRLLSRTNPAPNTTRFRVMMLLDTSVAMITCPGQTVLLDAIKIRRVGSATLPA